MQDLKSALPQTARPVQVIDPKALERARLLGNLLDNAISLPGGYRVGLDPLLGLVPGLGDLVGTLLAGYIVWVGARLGLPRVTLGRMVFNILLEAVLGLVPVLGDLFDFAWKANLRNLELLEAHVAQPQTARASDMGFAIGLLAVAGLVLVGLTGGFLFLLGALWHLFVVSLNLGT
ncbi:DUF4112 domain-containing protein [Anthocerotibacter panamensis]|uniref:DUF4112 domain-containing protein n=1 Tax=Anthocerotibacter panamensis TaxID=2857077 RepID=UPI001C4037D6|nr:DUF4112 domain-containing protein [Anthocerotibacter panamensis]